MPRPQPPPAVVARLARASVWQVELLPEAERVELVRLASELLATARLEGHNGQAITDEIRVSIAAQASLLALGFRRLPWPRLRTLHIYPDDFYGAPDEDSIGLRAGESHGSSIVLSWRGAQLGGLYPRYPSLVGHEFAHALESQDGAGEGFPRFTDAVERASFEQRLARLHDAHCDLQARRRPSALDPYALENVHEFFAEASASFVQRSAALRRAHPELYALLCDFYLQDPAARDGAALRARRPPEPGEAQRFDEAQQRRELLQFEETLRRYPDAAPALLGCARLLLLLGQPEPALAHYRRAIAASVGDADLLHETAIALMDADRPREAIELLDAAVRLVPSWALVRVDRGSAWSALGEWERAERDFVGALALDPELDVAWYARAQMHAGRSHWAEAGDCLEHALALLPGAPDYLALRATVREAQGDPEGARTDRAAATDPTDQLEA